jgi:hypothetical protein
MKSVPFSLLIFRQISHEYSCLSLSRKSNGAATALDYLPIHEARNFAIKVSHPTSQRFHVDWGQLGNHLLQPSSDSVLHLLVSQLPPNLYTKGHFTLRATLGVRTMKSPGPNNSILNPLLNPLLDM